MTIGITGHQQRDEIRWPWVEAAIRTELSRVPPGALAMSSLAAGADQVFARVAVDHGMKLVAVLPHQGYAQTLHGSVRDQFVELVADAELVELQCEADRETTYWKAGKFIVDRSDLLIAVWDGEPAHGRGGTGDIVAYAKSLHRRIVHVNPISESVSYLEGPE